MTATKIERRKVVEMTWQTGSDAVFCVRDRPLFAFWTLLQPFTKNVLLSPHSHVSAQTVSWSWLEPERATAPTPAQLSGVRKRLDGAVVALLDAIGEEPPASTQQVLSEAVSVLKELMMKSDSALLSFCAATVSGVMVHSWSFRRAAVPSCVDLVEREIHGTVSVGGTPAGGQEVVLEDIRGAVLARTRTDRDGQFIFGDLATGRFRVRGVSDQIDFPVTGLVVDVTQGSVRGLQLKSSATGKPRSPAKEITSADQVEDGAEGAMTRSSSLTPRKSVVVSQDRGWLWRGIVVLGLLAAVGGAGLFFLRHPKEALPQNGQDYLAKGETKEALTAEDLQKRPELSEKTWTQKMLGEPHRRLAAEGRRNPSIKDAGIQGTDPSRRDNAARRGTDLDGNRHRDERGERSGAHGFVSPAGSANRLGTDPGSGNDLGTDPGASGAEDRVGDSNESNKPVYVEGIMVSIPSRKPVEPSADNEETRDKRSLVGSKEAAASGLGTDPGRHETLGAGSVVTGNGSRSDGADKAGDGEGEAFAGSAIGTDPEPLGDEPENENGVLSSDTSRRRNSLADVKEGVVDGGRGSTTAIRPATAGRLGGETGRGLNLADDVRGGALSAAGSTGALGASPPSNISSSGSVPTAGGGSRSPGPSAPLEETATGSIRGSAVEPGPAGDAASTGGTPIASVSSRSERDGAPEKPAEAQDHSIGRLGPRTARLSDARESPTSHVTPTETHVSKATPSDLEAAPPITNGTTAEGVAHPVTPSSETGNPQRPSVGTGMLPVGTEMGTILSATPSLTRLMTVAPIPPRLVLSQDAVLMTRPMLEGSEDNVEEQRQKALQESQRQLPGVLAGAELSEGIAFSVPLGLLATPEPPRRTGLSSTRRSPLLVWKDAAGLDIDVGKTVGGRAELSWKRVMSAPGLYRLVDLRDRCWAEVDVSEEGQVTVAVLPAVQTQVWIEARINHDKIVGADDASWRNRLKWKSLDGRGLSESSERGASVLPDGGLRMEWVVEARPGANLVHHIALVDTVSRWAWLSVVQQTF